MTCFIDVSPYDGGWCVKICDTGEVLFFTGRRRAIVEAHSLARTWPRAAEVRVHGRSGELRSFEAWSEDDTDSAPPSQAFPYPLGVPA